MEKTRRAIDIAMRAHAGQTRKVSGLPYIVHPIEVYAICKKYKESHCIDEICAAAVLHDTLEDTKVTYADLTREFGGLVASLVQEVTTDSKKCSLQGKTDYINQKLTGLTSYALIIKLADMLANVTDNPAEKTIKRISAHMDHLSTCGRVLSGTHTKLMEQIRYSISTLYSEIA